MSFHVVSRWFRSHAPLLIDLDCGAGGAARGYADAGWDVIGVDIKPQPNFPFQFIQADSLAFMDRLLAGGTWEWIGMGIVDAFHASPPCQRNTTLKVMWNAGKHEDWITPTRPRLEASGRPWVIENVPGAPMRADVVLCGSMFGLGAGRRNRVGRSWGPYQLRRHRWFEVSGFELPLQPAHRHQSPTIGLYGDHVRHARRNGDIPMAEGFPLAQEAMGIDWMTWAEMAQAIPPAYTKWIGRPLLSAVTGRAA